MYRFARTAQLTGNPTKSIEWAVTIAEKVNQISEVPVTLWTSVLSPAVGLCAWTTTVETVTEIETMESKLLVDNGYLTLLAAGTEHIIPGAINDSLSTVIYETPGAQGGNFHYVSVTTGQVQPGQFRRGVELGVEIAQKAHALAGLETSFEGAVTGNMGTVTWILAADSIEQLQRGEDTLNTDETFLKLIDTEGAKAYQPHATVSFFRRML